MHEKFGASFTHADELYITGIYAAGEQPIEGISSELIYRAVMKSGIKNVHYMPDGEELERTLLAELRDGDLVLTLGAGDIWKLGERILEKKGEVNGP